MEKSWYNCNLSLSLSLFTQLFCFFCFCMLCLVLSSLLPTNQTKPNQTKKLLVYYLVNLDFVSCRLENFCPILSCPVLSECCPFFWFCFVHGHTMPMLIRAIMSCHSYTSPPFLSPCRPLLH